MESDEAREGHREEVYFCPKCGGFTRRGGGDGLCSQCGGPHSEEHHAQKYVLLVDDSEIARKKVGAILKKLGCELSEAKDGLEALDRARAEAPDLIVLDIQMPSMDGLEVLKELRKDDGFALTPIIMLTVEADASGVSEAISHGATDYIRKDTPVAQIIKRLRTHVEK
ncbi:MAG: response regulator [Candidatus Latescibacteria bacterium]|jgi:two-component system chemotaxis response regulator CheY|nr:response regulator [Candidatus Latescibacterota bacterium]